MASVNKRIKSALVYTHEGGKASKISNELKLDRAVCTCLLNENNYYEDGQSVKERIHDLMLEVSNEKCIEILKKAKFEYKLRHVPLYMLTVLAEKKALNSELVESVITRVDDITELIALYFENGKKPLSKQLAKGIAKSFSKFNEYQFGKYKAEKKQVSLKDAMILTHPKAPTDEQNILYKKILNWNLAVPYTWETELSAGKDKKEVFTSLLSENKLGALALLRNIRNMMQSDVGLDLISDGIFRKDLQDKMESALKDMDKLPGLTLFMIDTSGSMSDSTDNSKLTNAEKAASLAIMVDSLCKFSSIYTFDREAHEQKSRGFELADVCANTSGGTKVIHSANSAISKMNKESRLPNRIIILTDEQSSFDDEAESDLFKSIKNKYIINVAPYQNGICYNDTVHINGFSDGVLKYIYEYERLNSNGME